MNLTDIRDTMARHSTRVITGNPTREPQPCGCYINGDGLSRCGNCWNRYMTARFRETCYHPGYCSVVLVPHR